MRIRTIKPEFYRHSDLYLAEAETKLPLRVAFSGLWCAADREGRFKWRPLELGVTILPYDGIDFSRVLHALLTRGFVVKYRVGNEWFGCIPSFKRHQIINNREKKSDLPDVSEAEELDASGTRDPRVTHVDTGERKGRERKGREGNTRQVNQSITPAQGACAGAEEEQRFEEAMEPETHPAIVGPTGLPPSNDPDELEPDFDVEPPKGMPRTAADAFRRTPIDLQESLGKDVVATIWEELASTGWRNRHGILVTSWGAHIKTVGPLVKRAILREKTAGKQVSHKLGTDRVKSVGELIAEQAIREGQSRG